MHIHVSNHRDASDKLAKIWIERNGVWEVTIADQDTFTNAEMQEIIAIIEANRAQLEPRITNFFKHGKTEKVFKVTRKA